MRFRKLRIAWSVFSGLACVPLIVLWVTSYYSSDTLRWPAVELKSGMGLPYWCPVLMCGIGAAVPWIRWSNRFTLRTLLIATTRVITLHSAKE